MRPSAQSLPPKTRLHGLRERAWVCGVIPNKVTALVRWLNFRFCFSTLRKLGRGDMLRRCATVTAQTTQLKGGLVDELLTLAFLSSLFETILRAAPAEHVDCTDAIRKGRRVQRTGRRRLVWKLYDSRAAAAAVLVPRPWPT